MKRSAARGITRRLNFICEIDKVKSILRHTLLLNGSRRENDAEHAWHLAIMALVFSDLAKKRDLDLLKVIAMVLIHDIVEIDCGDALVYDEKLRARKKKQEARAAKRIFGLLPAAQARRFIALWKEFEARGTPEARFAAALDRFQPILHNCKTGGKIWRKENIDAATVLRVNRHIEEGSPLLWELVTTMVKQGSRRGFFAPNRKSPAQSR